MPATAKLINRIELYQQAASQINAAVPADAMRSSTLMDGKVREGKDPKGYAGSVVGIFEALPSTSQARLLAGRNLAKHQQDSLFFQHIAQAAQGTNIDAP